MRLEVLSFLVATVLFAPLAAAALSGVDQEISIGESAYTYSFRVENNSDVTKPLTVDLQAPVRVLDIFVPTQISPRRSERIILRIYPEQSVEGTTYNGQLSVDLGGEVSQKAIIMHFLSQHGCPLDIDANISVDGTVLANVTNKSYRPKAVKFQSIRNVPSDWKPAGDTDFSISPFETRTVQLHIERASTFSGNAELVFSCNGAGTSTLARTEFNGGFFSGLATIGYAVALADRDFIVDVFLIIIAAILLIAFIARLVRIMSLRAQ